jgi:hypothetical protein
MEHSWEALLGVLPGRIAWLDAGTREGHDRHGIQWEASLLREVIVAEDAVRPERRGAKAGSSTYDVFVRL